jgi:hypothetical protein
MKLFSVLRRRATRPDDNTGRSPGAQGDLDIDPTARLIMTEEAAGRILLARRLAAADIDSMDEVDAASEEVLEAAFGYGSTTETADEAEMESADR